MIRFTRKDAPRTSRRLVPVGLSLACKHSVPLELP